MKSVHEYRGYVFQMSYAAEEPAYVVEFHDIPEIITSGATPGAAFGNACEALDLHLDSLAKLGRRLPRPRHRLVVESIR